MTLPLSYSRLRGSLLSLTRRLRRAGRHVVANDSACRNSNQPFDKPAFRSPRTSSRREAPRQKTEEALRLASLAQGTIRLDRASPRRACHERGREAPESNGGEGRVRTSVATRAAGLQPAAIDRSATSPNRFRRASGDCADARADTGINVLESCLCDVLGTCLAGNSDGAGGGI